MIEYLKEKYSIVHYTYCKIEYPIHNLRLKNYNFDIFLKTNPSLPKLAYSRP